MMKGGANGADGKGLLPMFALKPWFGIKVIKFQKKVKKKKGQGWPIAVAIVQY